MTPIALGALGALALLAFGKPKKASANSSSPRGSDGLTRSEREGLIDPWADEDDPDVESAADEVAREKARIVQEAKAIVDGERDAFTDDDPFGPEVTAPNGGDPGSSAAASASDDAKRAAEQAAALAAAELGDTSPAPKTKTKPATKTTTTAKKPATKTTTVAPTPQPFAPAPSPSGTSQSPPGYDPEGARRMVPSIVNNLRNKGRSGYDRKMLQAFQTKAGLKADKFYGGATRGALLYYGGVNPPVPFTPPLDTIPYRPPA